MYACVYACACMCVWVCVHARAHVCMCVLMYVHKRVCVYSNCCYTYSWWKTPHMYVHMYICMYTCVDIHQLHVYTCVGICTCRYSSFRWYNRRQRQWALWRPRMALFRKYYALLSVYRVSFLTFRRHIQQTHRYRRGRICRALFCGNIELFLRIHSTLAPVHVAHFLTFWRYIQSWT